MEVNRRGPIGRKTPPAKGGESVKRNLIPAAAIVLAALTLTACGGGEPEAVEPSPTETAIEYEAPGSGDYVPSGDAAASEDTEGESSDTVDISEETAAELGFDSAEEAADAIEEMTSIEGSDRDIQLGEYLYVGPEMEPSVPIWGGTKVPKGDVPRRMVSLLQSTMFVSDQESVDEAVRRDLITPAVAAQITKWQKKDGPDEYTTPWSVFMKGMTYLSALEDEGQKVDISVDGNVVTVEKYLEEIPAFNPEVTGTIRIVVEPHPEGLGLNGMTITSISGSVK